MVILRVIIFIFLRILVCLDHYIAFLLSFLIKIGGIRIDCHIQFLSSDPLVER